MAISRRALARVRNLTAVAAVVLLHAAARGPVRAAFGWGDPEGPDTDDAQLVLLSWNLCNFGELGPGRGPGGHARER
ncbi:MAG: hypothetical protein IAG13_10270, partial [Deltaproteobacteria bacterium]|nr:hypothetical protein [Nannocystaceae bacterium]